MGAIDEGAGGRAIVLVGHVHPIEQRLVGVERTRGVDRGAIIRERAELLLHGVIRRAQRLLGVDINDSARLDEPVKNGARTFEHLHARDVAELHGVVADTISEIAKNPRETRRGSRFALKTHARRFRCLRNR